MSANFDNDPEFSDTLPKPRSRRGIRIIEVMVVIGIIGIMIGLRRWRRAVPHGRDSGEGTSRVDVDFWE
jgi:hypothetical protein